MTLRSLLPMLPALVLAGCTVYAPTQPYVPLVQARGQGEALFQTQGTVRPELSAAYSPLPHLLVLGGGLWRPSLPLEKDGKPDDFRITQGWGGLGAYQPLGPRWTCQLTAGAGLASTQRTVSDGGLLLAYNARYEARYAQYFGQPALYYQVRALLIGGSYRLTWVIFQQLAVTDHDFGPSTNPLVRHELPLTGQLRHEPAVFFRRTLHGPEGHWQLQGSLAYYFCIPGQDGNLGALGATTYRVQFNRGGGLLLSGGISYRFGQPAANQPRVL